MINNILLGINLLGFLLIAMFLMRSRGRSLFSPGMIFNIGFFYSYFISGYLLLGDTGNFTIYPQIKKDLAYAEIYFLLPWVGLLAFNFAYAGARFPVCVASHEKAKQGSSFLPLILFGLSVASVIGIAFVINLDPFVLLTNLDEWERVRDLAMRSWADNAILFVLPVYLSFFHLWTLATLSPSRLTSFLLFVLTLMSLLVIGSRALVLSWIVGLLAYKYAFSGVKFKVFHLVVLALIASGGALLGQFQNQNVLAASLADLDFPFNHLKRLQVSYEQFENLVALMGANFSFDFGRSIFEDIFITYIPREIFPWKPEDVGFLRAQNVLFYDDFWSLDRGTTYPVGIIGELYFNFWYLGVPVGMYILGKIVRRLELLAYMHREYIPLVCTLSGVFLAPHRTYGTLLMMIFIYLLLLWMNKKISEKIWPSRGFLE